MTTFDGSSFFRNARGPRPPCRARPRALDSKHEKATGRPEPSRPHFKNLRLVARPWGRGLVGVSASAAGPVAGARPRGPEDHREHEADGTDDHQDPADRVLVDAADV